LESARRRSEKQDRERHAEGDWGEDYTPGGVDKAEISDGQGKQHNRRRKGEHQTEQHVVEKKIRAEEAQLREIVDGHRV
jgi:hypothetical protein